VLRQVNAFYTLDSSQPALRQYSDEALNDQICRSLDCSTGTVAWGVERAKRWAGEKVEALGDRISSSPAADAVRVVQAKAADVDKGAREIAAYTVGQGLGTTTGAMGGARSLPPDAAADIHRNGQTANKVLGDLAVDAGEEGLKNVALGAVVKGTGVALEARALAKEEKAAARALANEAGAAEKNLYNIAPHGKQPSPRSPLASHHGIQRRDLEANVPGYDAEKDPTILLDRAKHSQLTGEQATARAAGRAGAGNPYPGDYGAKRAAAIEQMRRAGVPEEEIGQWVLEHDGYMFGIDRPGQ
jgi:hypothetical protein